MKTQYDIINPETSAAKIVDTLPTAPVDYYGHTLGQVTGRDEWRGGELAYLTTSSKLHVQTATSGLSATWRLIDEAFASTTSTSTSTSTTSSTSTSTSTSSSTSTSTSTSSTTTSA